MEKNTQLSIDNTIFVRILVFFFSVQTTLVNNKLSVYLTYDSNNVDIVKKEIITTNGYSYEEGSYTAEEVHVIYYEP